MYKSFLDDLKSKSFDKKKHPNAYSKSFADIDDQSFDRITDEDRKEVSWSSQYDPVTRSPFAKDVIHLHSLLDALLASKNFDRAERILGAIYPLLSNPESFIFTLNEYLKLWALEDTTTLDDVEASLSKFTTKFPATRLNDRTYAILLTKYMSTNTPYIDYISKFTVQKTRQIFTHIDIIGTEGLMEIFKHPEISESHVPNDFIHLFKQVRGELVQDVPQYFTQDLQAPTIEKDSEDLKPVDSFGLKIIRHTLLGLKEETGSGEFEAILKDLEKDLNGHLLHNASETPMSSKRDYFQLYKTLKTQEQKDKFNEALDLFNEARQRQLEIRGVDGAKEKWKHEFEEMQKRGGISLNKGLNAQLFKWYSEFLPYVEEEIKQCQNILLGTIDKEGLSAEELKVIKEREFYAPYLVLVPPQKMCVVTILELLKLTSTGGIDNGMRAARALISVGKAIELEYRSQALVNTEKKVYSKKLKTTNQWKKLLRKKKNVILDSTTNQPNDWSYTVYAKIGAVLVSLLKHVAKVPVKGIDPTTGKSITGSQPAIHHTYKYSNGQKLGVFIIHKEVVKQLAGKSFSNCVQPQLLPMLVPPRPWNSYNDGGYLFSQTQLVRIKDSVETSAYLKAASEMGNLDEIYQGLNVLGNTAWTVNRRVLDVITKHWNTGKEFLDIPPIIEEPNLPKAIPLDAEPNEKFEYQKKVRQAINDAASAKSQRCDTNYKLEIARGFLGEKLFFPHNVDFRGRAYPLSPHFNHLGNDLTRSLFLFWEGKEIGENGLRWLKIHLANVFGIDKAPLAKRVEFVNENLENIFQSAQNPYDPQAWWLKGEKPWQVLSVCFELNEAYKMSDPTKFVSHIPVHQDGTCNGLQHYAALGGDIEGARQVNLLPADKPQDVYSFVASLVQKRIDSEAEEGNKYALFLQDKITRKVVKQTVMTNVYGVTFVGAAAQIKKQLDHHFTKDMEEDVVDYARYLTLHVFASVRELFEGAHHIQDWLGESAKRISKSVRIDYEDSQVANKPNHLSSVIWTTPLGLPCVQPYRVAKNQLIKTNLQDISISDPFGTSQVDARKQQAAFPPNFVHSLDATHMLMTSRSCGEKGLSFAAVHDSYWTHASDVDIMNAEIRNQFVNLHKSNLINQVRDEFEKRYKDCLQVILIPGDHELAKKIKDIRRNIVKSLGRALTVADEIYLEKKRLQLLGSSDPSVVQTGKEMITTVSITEGYNVEELTVSSASSKAFQILVPLKFPEVPERGDLDVELVKESDYFFS
ncbi:mitochondrial DNA-directed RNA polymerase [Suhomyces tanzawaensis NRRL Y-17324]|uniref:DNA-directed RNA polymerase n=1 Tax=Suhomyces tanzawaensis NRRL Y-17324 TaxID=984487 RepID=A0A1E4SMT6_9ASCO|nr:mitochondrial DNA-directed RNA polymerase [Suhomyces tanzawaensis NRRL Y-17324]ODV80798.1 mitochondrial DNA-directed RNA polymerase [Suhomyces tanzawaensis NRRL Y-17324]